MINISWSGVRQWQIIYKNSRFWLLKLFVWRHGIFAGVALALVKELFKNKCWCWLQWKYDLFHQAIISKDKLILKLKKFQVLQFFVFVNYILEWKNWNIKYDYGLFLQYKYQICSILLYLEFYSVFLEQFINDKILLCKRLKVCLPVKMESWTR